jgi:prepilin-type N-terminal cleavage/methylation domain-containing protein
MEIQRHKGFTLLEILLVIAAIGILASIVLIAINPNRQLAQARNLVRQADINTIQKALEQYLIDNGRYTNSVSSTPGYICNTGTEQTGGSTNCSGRVDLRELVPTYIAGIPKDPQATGTNTGYIVANQSR